MVTLQERLETSRGGRLLISVFLVTVLAVLLVANIPHARVRKVAADPIEPALRATGLTQGWYVFAPDPVRSTVRLVAVIRFDDGSSATWTPPSSNRFLGAYRDYHWRVLDAAAQIGVRSILWSELARWLTATYESQSGKRVTKIIFYRGEARTPRPGSPREPAWEVQKLRTFTPHDGS